MLISNVNYTSTASITPANADSPVYNWTIQDGTIISGQGSDTILYKFNLVTNETIRTITLNVVNPCGGASFSKDFFVCDSISNANINGASFVYINTSSNYNVTYSNGNPHNFLWSLASGNSQIIDGQGTETVTLEHLGLGMTVLNLSFVDCEGTLYSLTYTIQVASNCTPVISCSF